MPSSLPQPEGRQNQRRFTFNSRAGRQVHSWSVHKKAGQHDKQFRNGKAAALTVRFHFAAQAGPLAVTTFTGQPADAEPDILDACEYLEMSRKEVDLWLCLAEPELKEEFRNPVVVQEIMDSARDYANTIFRNDFCIDWGIRRYRLEITEPQNVEQIGQ